jgi:hypothetical protein
LDTTLDSTSDFISPIIDRERHSVKIIRNFIREEGQPSSKYVTRDIKLASAADRLDVYFDINRPSAAVSCEVYAQFVYEASSDSAAVTTDFIPMNREYPSNIPVNADPGVYTEMHYNIDPPQDFEEFRVMITFEGSNIVDAPTIKRLRAIATV